MNTKRLSLLVFLFIACACVLLVRLFYWQILQGPSLQEKAWKQSQKITHQTFPRGKIYASDGFPLVTNQTVFDIGIYRPNLKISDRDLQNALLRYLPPVSTKSAQKIDTFLTDTSKKWLEIDDGFLAPDIASLSALHIDGIELLQREKRIYPESSMAAQLLGIVAKNTDGTNQGYLGIEGYYHHQLAGKTGLLWASSDARGRSLLAGIFWKNRGSPGRDLYLHLDRTAQYIVDTILAQAVRDYGAEEGTITVMDSKTGSILAMATYPSFDPTKQLVASNSATPNPIVFDLYEPGSVFKPIVMAMAFEDAILTPSSICPVCDRPYTVGEYEINNWNKEFYPDSTMQDIITHSDNIGMSYVIQEIGKDRFLDFAKQLEIGQKTGIDLQEEVAGQAFLAKKWYPIDLATASFGQGIALTRIQLLRAFNSLAYGELVTPKILAYWEQEGKTDTVSKNETKRVFSEKTVGAIKSVLNTAVTSGSVARFVPPGMLVAAKSGTAQVAIAGQYEADQGVASYIGFAPAFSPRFSMLVTFTNPKTSPWGASTAAPVWFEVAKKLYFLFGIPIDSR